MQDKYILL